MKVEEVQQCSFQNWYEDFKKITMRSIILPLPDGFVDYILKDGIVLPQNSGITYTVEDDNSSESDIEDTWKDSNIEEAQPPNFADFDSRIKDAIDTLGGRVFPKLNWSSPRDASWIAFNNSCCCTSVSDIYLLLKSSDFIIHDLTNAFKHCEDYSDDVSDAMLSQPSKAFYLVLRRWVEIDTSAEFRCFVNDNKLLGISQREHTLYFDHIPFHKKNIVEDIASFFKEHIQNKFPCSSYVFDVYRKKEGEVHLVDFNPFGIVTDSLLFSWKELTCGSLINQNECLPVFRYVSENCGVQPRHLRSYAIPKDIIDISTGEDSFKLVDLIKLKMEEQQTKTSDDDDDNEINQC